VFISSINIFVVCSNLTVDIEGLSRFIFFSSEMICELSCKTCCVVMGQVKWGSGSSYRARKREKMCSFKWGFMYSDFWKERKLT
jgi:hypothetical protein